MNSVKKLICCLLVGACTLTAKAETSVKFRFPIANSDRHLMSSLPIIGMDHDQLHGSDKSVCTNFHGAGAPFCYNDHRGTDYSLIGGFITMDKGSAKVVAAAPGKVTKVSDGNFDRCSVDLKTMDVSCWGNPMRANLVEITHKNGVRTQYLHLKKGSVRVKEGQSVKCGQVLGLVGSSGRSSLPHLHFTVIEEDGQKVDPYGGRFSTQDFDYWKKAFMADGLPSASCGREERPGGRCKWESIQSATRCGVELVTSAEACGSDIYNCGTEIVACGTQTVTDAAKCGVKTVTSAAQCGVDTLTNLFECAQKGLAVFNGACEVPKSCTVPNTCTISKTCEVAKLCEQPLSCELPKTCQIKKCQ